VRQIPRLYVFALGLAIVPPVAAQSATNDTLATSMMHMIMDPARWHVSLQGAASHNGTFLSQHTNDGDVAIRTSVAPSLGGGGGFDINDNTNLRLGYTYTPSKLRYRDWNGTGSNALNISNIGNLTNNVVSFEAQHYFVGSRSLVSPYAGVGLAGVWSHLSPENQNLLTTPGGSQKFGWAPTANFGAQVRLTSEFYSRLEWATMGMPNPFDGNRAFRSPLGVTYDQPSRVSKQEWRVAAVYYFGKVTPSQQKPTVATSP
jgi:outer membrane protein W